MALHKTLGEIRALPYPEYRSWELFYTIEPFGFINEEYRTGAVLSMLYNINRGKGKAKDTGEFMRDMPSEILKQFKTEPDINAMSRDEIIKVIKKDFGIT